MLSHHAPVLAVERFLDGDGAVTVHVLSSVDYGMRCLNPGEVGESKFGPLRQR